MKADVKPESFRSVTSAVATRRLGPVAVITPLEETYPAVPPGVSRLSTPALLAPTGIPSGLPATSREAYATVEAAPGGPAAPAGPAGPACPCGPAGPRSPCRAVTAALDRSDV